MERSPVPLAAIDIHVHRGDVPVLRGVSLAAVPGQVLGLIGPNGSGKSTLLTAMAGLLPLAGGEVRLNGAPLAAVPAQERARCIGYLEQSPQAHWPLTVERLVMLGRLPHRRTFAGESAADHAAVAAAMDRAEVTHFCDRAANTLSGGERARVMLARVLAGQPDVLLADEPVAGLDPYHQLQVMALLRGLADDGGAVVVVVHDLTLAWRWCDTVALLHRGQLAASGAPSDVLANPVTERVFQVAFQRGADWMVPQICRPDAGYKE